MGFNCGIVGLPNVGKSTLFNALTQTQSAESANYPFCTIEPNKGKVSIPDERLDKIAAICGSEKIIRNQLEFIDIAGLVKGASKGEGLGNQFLANIRETDAICHVLRCFDNGDITHVEGSVDPIRDADIIETELMLADLASLETRQANLKKKSKGNDKDVLKDLELIEVAINLIEQGIPARKAEISSDDEKRWNMLQLITAKPVLYVCNVDEDSASCGNDYTKLVIEKANQENAGVVFVSAAIESEIVQIEDTEERQEFLESLGLKETGLAKIIKAGFDMLGQITFFTAGPKEARAWNVLNGATAPNAAGVIHTDFERGFICAETIAYEDFVEFGGESGAKDKGKLRQEGKTYLVKDGDVMHFMFNV